MNRFAFIVLFSLLSFGFAPETACAAPSPAEIETRKRDVLQTEQKRIDALKHDDLATLDRILSDDLTYTHSNSVSETKSQFLESLKSGRMKYKSLDHEGQVVRVYGDTAVLTGTSTVRLNSAGKDLELKLRFTIVYVKQEGRWKMVAWQSTRFPA